MSLPRQNSFEVRVPASTANLGAGFDCLGLALELFLKVRATVLPGPGAKSLARSRGVAGSALLPSSPEQNLILRAMCRTAEKEGMHLPAVRLAVQNSIPVAGGLGSSAAATVAGIALAYTVGGREIPRSNALELAREIEGHADNVAASLMGGLVVTLVRADGTTVAVRKPWPKVIRIVVVTPLLALETKKSRAVLPKLVERSDAVHNLQRSALLVAAIEERRYELLWDALQDRLHQSYRQHLVPGLTEILAMPRVPGLLGVALSGSGPSVIALAIAEFQEIGKTISGYFERHGLKSTVRILEAAQEGLIASENRSSRK